MNKKLKPPKEWFEQANYDLGTAEKMLKTGRYIYPVKYKGNIKMAKSKIKKIIEYLKNLLEDRGVKIDKIILFGSYARRDYKEDSDVDIVIISKDFSNKGIFERAKMLGDIEWKLMDKFLIPLDIITMSPEDFKKGISPISQYAKGGEIIYGR